MMRHRVNRSNKLSQLKTPIKSLKSQNHARATASIKYETYEIEIIDDLKDLKRWTQNLLNKIKNIGIPKGYRGYPIENIENALKLNSSVHSVQPVVSPVDDAWTILEIMSEINEIAEKGILPDGDGVNEPTRMWAEDAARRFKEKYKTVKLFEKG